MKKSLVYRDKNRKVIQLFEFVKGDEWYLEPVPCDFLPLNHVCFFDVRINRYLIYKLHECFISARGIRPEWVSIDAESRSMLGKYVKILLLETDNRGYREFGPWVLDELDKSKIINTVDSRQDLKDYSKNMDKPSEAELNFCRKYSELMCEAQEDLNNIESGRILHSFSPGAASTNKKKPKKVIFVGMKTGKKLGETYV